MKKVCKPVVADDGIFWLEKDEFFKYFGTIHVCAKNMSRRVVQGSLPSLELDVWSTTLR